MHPSTTQTGGATPVRHLPEAGRDDMLKTWGLNGSAHWTDVERNPRRQDDAADLDAMGAEGWDDPTEAAHELEELGFIVDGGWTPAAIKNNRHHNGGMTSHRGVLHPAEYVDVLHLMELVEAELGFTYEEVYSVYRQGPLSADQRELRGRIDARLLALSRSGGNMNALGAVLGFQTPGDTMHRVVKGALARARAAEAEAVAT